MTAVKNHDWVQMSAARTGISPHSVQSFLTQAALDSLSELGARGELIDWYVRNPMARAELVEAREVGLLCLHDLASRAVER